MSLTTHHFSHVSSDFSLFIWRISLGTFCMSNVTSHLSHVNYHPSHVAYPMSPVTCWLSHVTCHIQFVTCNLSLATSQFSHVTCRLSKLTCYTSLVSRRFSHSGFFRNTIGNCLLIWIKKLLASNLVQMLFKNKYKINLNRLCGSFWTWMARENFSLKLIVIDYNPLKIWNTFKMTILNDNTELKKISIGVIKS